MGRLDRRVALLSGATGGLGRAFARALVAEGARLVLGDLDVDAGRELAEELGAASRFCRLDVTDPGGWTGAVKLAEAEFGVVDVLVNNAGIGRSAEFSAETLDGFRSVIEVNLFGTFNGMTAVVPGMKRLGRGSIVNISSIAGLTGWWHGHGYTASKFAVRGLTKSTALDLGPFGIRINSVHPGMIETPMKGSLTYLSDHVALQRSASAAEIAPLVVFLASDESSYCTGGEFAADGGATAGRRGPAFAEVVEG